MDRYTQVNFNSCTQWPLAPKLVKVCIRGQVESPLTKKTSSCVVPPQRNPEIPRNHYSLYFFYSISSFPFKLSYLINHSLGFFLVERKNADGVDDPMDTQHPPPNPAIANVAPPTHRSNTTFVSDTGPTLGDGVDLSIEWEDDSLKIWTVSIRNLHQGTQYLLFFMNYHITPFCRLNIPINPPQIVARGLLSQIKLGLVPYLSFFLSIGTPVDKLVDAFHLIPSLRIDHTYVNDSTHWGYAGFDSLQGYTEALTVVINFGELHHPPDYNPLKAQGVFYQVLMSCSSLIGVTNPIILEALKQNNLAVSSLTLNSLKRCVTVYFVNEAAWKSALTLAFIPLKNNVGNTVNLIVVPSFASTSDKAWTKLFVAGLPSSSFEMFTKMVTQRFRVQPEILTLQRNQNGTLGKFGYILTKEPSIVEKLLKLSEKERTSKLAMLFE